MSVFHSRSFSQSVKRSNPDPIAPKDDSDQAAAEPPAQIAAAQQKRLRKILETIESEPPRNIFDLAQEFNLSPSHLQHVFKQQTGVCLGRVLTEQRLQRAADLLTNSNLSIKEIAAEVGYEHTSSFIRAFERRFLQAPRRYRDTR